MKLKTLIMLPLFSFTALAQAHMLWLERDAQGTAYAYFGEFADDQRETREGLLKRFDGIKAHQQGVTLEAQALEDRFSFASKGAADVSLSQTRIHKETRVTFEAKTGRQDTQRNPLLNLELVPESPDSNRFVLLFQGQPLAKTEVTAISPQKWSKSFRTDEQGKITLLTPWPGQYLLEVSHSFDSKGTEDGKPYEKVRYVHSLSLQAN